jgi:hypothetical protein
VSQIREKRPSASVIFAVISVTLLAKSASFQLEGFYMKFDIGEFNTSVEKFQICLQWDKNIGNYTGWRKKNACF